MTEDILYSLVWEDTHVFKKIPKDGHRNIIIGSAGCSALSSFAYHNINLKIVDTNEEQLKLIRLKTIAFKYMNYSDCMFFLGVFTPSNNNNRRLELFNQISDYLPTKDVQYWENRSTYILSGIIHIGKFEKYLRIFGQYLLPFSVGRKTIKNFLNSNGLIDQKYIYINQIDNWKYRLIFKTFFGKMIMKQKGRHPDLFKYIHDKPNEVFYNRSKRAWYELPINNNYYLRYILQGYFDPSLNLPPWAMKKNYEKIKKRISNIEYHHSNLIDLLKNLESNYDMIYVSNIAETMGKEESTQLFDLCAKRLNKSGKLIIWNNMVERKPDDQWELEESLANQLWEKRLSSFYGFFGVYSLK